MRLAPVDVAAALGLSLAAQVEVWAPDLMVGTGQVEGSRPVLSVTALAMTASVCMRRGAPLAFAALVAASTAAQALATTPAAGLTEAIVLVAAAHAAAAYTPLRPALACLGALLVALVPSHDVADWTFAALLATAAWVAGLVLRRRGAAVVTARAERDAAASAERARIARELHDIVSHRVTTIVVQAQAGSALAEQEPAAARRAFAAIDEAGRQALAELRDLLDVLRGGDEPGERGPQPGLDDIGDLVADSRETGLPVELVVEGDPYEVEAGLGLAAYRIVQEALTNAVRHTGNAATRVLIRFTPTALELLVSDRGGARDRSGSGHGLAGMRERAALYGGSVEAGADDAGFSVRASLPVRTR